MILEVATLNVIPGREAEFEAAFGFRGSSGYLEWKQVLNPFYDPFPAVEHYAAVPGAPD